MGFNLLQQILSDFYIYPNNNGLLLKTLIFIISSKFSAL